MGYSVNSFAIAILIISVIIYMVLNKKLRKEMKEAFNIPIIKSKFTLTHVFWVIISVVIIIIFFKNLIIVKQNINYINNTLSYEINLLNESNKKAEEMRKTYKNLISEIQTDLENCKNPYIPEGFKYVEGQWNTGFVIEDESGNQFVWVPCSNEKNNEGIPVLKKMNFVANPLTSYFYCFEGDDDYVEFLRSSLENGGFYIARFEIGKEGENPVSKAGVEIWTNISQEEAKEVSEGMYSQINSKLINGFAYDTAFNFIRNEIGNECDDKSTGITGTKSYKNIYDIVDTMCEYTSEMQYDSVVYRGVMASNKYISVNTLDCTRLVAVQKFTASNIGFRTILYK
jgi:hypothetical protein